MQPQKPHLLKYCTVYALCLYAILFPDERCTPPLFPNMCGEWIKSPDTMRAKSKHSYRLTSTSIRFLKAYLNFASGWSDITHCGAPNTTLLLSVRRGYMYMTSLFRALLCSEGRAAGAATARRRRSWKADKVPTPNTFLGVRRVGQE